MNELWKSFTNIFIKNIYSISTLAQVLDNENEITITPTKSTNGNLYVELKSSDFYQSLYKHKTVKISLGMMMADAFNIRSNYLIKAPYKLIHKDGNLENCKLDNLELVEDQEIWVPLDIKDTIPGMYELSSFGNIRNLKTGKILSRFTDQHNILSVAGIRRTNGRYRNMMIRVLLATYFIPGKQTNYDKVRNINGIGTDVSLHNIEWFTPYRDDEEHPDEIWVDLLYPKIRPDTYIISSYGRIKNKITGQPMKPMKGQYYAVKLMHVNNKSYPHDIHRLVCTMFNPNPNQLPVVNHIDGNRYNNYYKNLEWCTQKDNVMHAIRTGLFQPWENYTVLKGDDSPMTKVSDKVIELICKLLIKHYGDINNTYHELIDMGIDNVSIYVIKHVCSKECRSNISDQFFSMEEMNQLKRQRIKIIIDIIERNNNDIESSIAGVNKIFPYISLTELKKIYTRYYKHF